MTRRPELPALDLLTPRRFELGLSAAPPPTRSIPRLLLPTGVMAFGLLLVVLLVNIWLQKRERSLEDQLSRLQPVEQRITDLRTRLRKNIAQFDALEADTRRIASELVSIRSSSALLEQLKRVTPLNVRLQTVVVQPTKITVEGFAQLTAGRGDGLQSINALMLNFNDLKAVPEDGSRLKRAKKASGQSMAFNLDVDVDATITATPEQLIELGSLGMARRLRLLRDLGMAL